MNKLAGHNKDALDRATNQRRHLRDLDIGVGVLRAFGIRRDERRPYPPAGGDKDQAAPEKEESALSLCRFGGRLAACGEGILFERGCVRHRSILSYALLLAVGAGARTPTPRALAMT